MTRIEADRRSDGVLVIPTPGSSLLAEGLCGARPPRAWRCVCGAWAVTHPHCDLGPELVDVNGRELTP